MLEETGLPTSRIWPTSTGHPNKQSAMNIHPQVRATTPETTEHFDVLIVGAGISGIGGAYHLTQQCPGHELRRRSRRRRASAARGSPTAIPASAPTATSTPSATASSRGPARRSPPRPRSSRTWARSSTRTTSAATSATGTGSTAARWSSADNLWTIEATRTDTGEALRFTANFLWMCQGYYRHAEGYTPEWPGMDRLHGPHRPPADLAGGPRLRGQARRRHRLRRHGGDADPGDGGRLRARHHAAALADLLPHRPQRHRDRRRAARARRSTRRGSTRSCAARSSTSRPCSPAAAFAEPETVKRGAARRRPRHPRPRLRHRARTSRRATGPGGSASPSCPTATCSRRIARRQGVGRHRRDRALHRDRHPAEVRQARSRPTSSSPPPASTSACSATSTSRSTASRWSSPTPSPIAA